MLHSPPFKFALQFSLEENEVIHQENVTFLRGGRITRQPSPCLQHDNHEFKVSKIYINKCIKIFHQKKWEKSQNILFISSAVCQRIHTIVLGIRKALPLRVFDLRIHLHTNTD